MAIALKVWTWIRKNGAGLMGLLNSLIRVLRELIIIVVRIIALILPDKFIEEKVIKRIGDVFDKIEDGVKVVTDLLLKITQ